MSAGPSTPLVGEPGHDVADGAAGRDRETGGGRLHRTPGAERKAADTVLGERHGARQHADCEQAAAEADQRRADAEEQRPSRSGAAKMTAEKATTPASAP